MKLKDCKIYFALIYSMLLLFSILLSCSHTPSNGGVSEQDMVPFIKRNYAMEQISNETQNILIRLKELNDREKDAVVALMAVTKAVTTYESQRIQRNDKLLGDYYRKLNGFSAGCRSVGKYQGILMDCFDESVSCLSAKKKCLDEGGKEDECDRDPKVIEACGKEAACITKAFLDLKPAIPEILSGRDPWPPLPFPY